MACRGFRERCSTANSGANQAQIEKHRMEKFSMLMRVTACYRTKPIDVMAVKKRKMNSALWIAE